MDFGILITPYIHRHYNILGFILTVYEILITEQIWYYQIISN